MKNKVMVILFLFIIYGFFILNLFVPDTLISSTERRKLQQFPEFNVQNLMNKTFMKRFDDYGLDQFIFRDKFRSLKANFSFKILHKLDNNKIYVKNDNIFKSEYPLNKDSVNGFIKKMNILNEKYFKSNNVYLSIIPDKNYYLKDKNYLNLDYNYIFNYVPKMLNKFHFIDLRDSLDLNSYYRTDTHWRQEKLYNVVDTLGSNMGFNLDWNYEYKSYFPFYGVYYGQSALDIKPDKINYLYNNNFNNIVVNNYEKEDIIYNTKLLSGMDSYDVFLSGACSLIKLDNPNSISNKELIIFRDSFGSSLAPLLTNYYKSITLVDMRYMNMNFLEQNVNFDNKDILIIYNTMIINSSGVLKIF